MADLSTEDIDLIANPFFAAITADEMGDNLADIDGAAGTQCHRQPREALSADRLDLW